MTEINKNNEFLSFNNIPKFSGVEANKNPADWIDYLTLIFEENNLEKDKWLGYALMNISPKVAADFTSFRNINPIKTTEKKWDHFVRFLQVNYGHISSVDDAMDKLRTIKLENDIYWFNNSFRHLITQVGWKPDNAATLAYYRGFMPSRISRELISAKPETLAISMSIAQDIFKAHNLGIVNNENSNINSYNSNIRDDSAMDIDNININATYQQSFNNRNNYQRNFRNNSNNNINYRGRNSNQKGRIRYEWFKDSITKEQYEDRMKKGLCVLCGSWLHIVYKCPEVKHLGKV